MNGRTISAISLSLLLAVALGGCGRAGKPEFPDESIYPQSYPNPALKPSAQKPLKMTPPGETAFVDPSVRAAQINSPILPVGIPGSPIDEDDNGTRESYSPVPPIQAPIPMQVR